MTRFITIIASALGLASFAPTFAQEVTPAGAPLTEDFIHYSYGTLFGTGIYQLDDRTVALFRAPISLTLRELTREQSGLKLRLPVALGLYNYDLLDDLLPDSDHFATVSVVPGLEWQHLIGDHWRIATGGYLGFGSDLTSSERSVIYGATVSALRPLPVKFAEMQFGSAFLISGYNSNKTSNNDFLTRWSVGIDASAPIGLHIDEREVFLGTHLIGYYYLNRVEFKTILDESIKLRGELEIGLFVGARPAPKLFGLEIKRLGIGYRFSGVSDAVVFFAGFPF